MTKKQLFSTCYFLSGAFFLGYGYTTMISLSKYDAWIGAILGIIFGSGIVALIGYINKVKGKQSLSDFLHTDKIIGTIIKILLLLFSSILFIFTLANLESFASSFFLIKTPNFIIGLPIVLLMIQFGKSGLKCVGRVAEILYIISLPIFTFFSIAFIQYINLDNIQPIMMSSMTDILLTALVFAIFSAAPYMVLLNIEDDGKHYVKRYLLSAVISIGIIFVIISVLGPNLIEMYRYPEYVVLKKFKVFNFVERIENIVAVIWLFDCIILLASYSCMIKDLLPNKHKSWAFGGILFLLYLIATILLANAGWMHSNLNKLAFFIGIAFLICIIPILLYTFIKKKKQKMKE